MRGWALIYDTDFLKCPTVWRKTYVFESTWSQAVPDGRTGSLEDSLSQADTGRDLSLIHI